MTTLPLDPLFSQQWFLYNTGQSGGTAGMDLNVVNVWDDYTGNGVIVGVVDDGTQYTHPDLDANYDTSLDYDAGQNDNDSAPVYGSDNHGTAVAGIIAAEAGNGIGGVGVAYNSTVTTFRMDFQGLAVDPLTQEARALGQLVNVDVANNSWGYDSTFFDNFSTSLFQGAAQSIRNAITNGRDGLGTGIVFPPGNERDEGNNTNYHNYQNSRYIITVAALDHNGVFSSYSTPGASVLVSAFGSGIPGSIVTTDRQGNAGYSAGDYTFSFNGTSAATPMVTGVVALMLEANPNLGYRDIQEILAYSARRTDANNAGWDFNGANNWNGGGLHVSHDYGFGLVDAHAAVRLSETWQAQSKASNETSLSVLRSNLGIAIPDNNTTGISDTIAMSAGLQVDFVEVELNLTHTWRGDLEVTLVSPNGTESVLVNRPLLGGDSGDNIVFTLSSTHHWGESSGGNWTLKIRDLAGLDLGTLNSWRLNLYGDTDTNNDTYIYTNEYGIHGATTLNDASGSDTINAAAITSSSVLNLTPGTTSTLAGTALTISSGTVIEKAFTGDGNDTIVGNSVANSLFGGRGNDSLIGNAGNDALDGGRGNDTLMGGLNNDNYIVDSLGDVVTENAGEGKDTVQSSISYTLAANVENLKLLGASNINGTGNTLNNVITGNNGNNTLAGGDGKDTLIGKNGNDVITGGSGNDNFTFNSPTEGIDTITDFSVVNDTINVSRNGFGGGLVANAVITSAQFLIGTAATTIAHRFIYNSISGALIFDQDGSGGGIQAQIATLGTGLALTNNDIFVIA